MATRHSRCLLINMDLDCGTPALAVIIIIRHALVEAVAVAVAIPGLVLKVTSIVAAGERDNRAKVNVGIASISPAPIVDGSIG